MRRLAALVPALLLAASCSSFAVQHWKNYCPTAADIDMSSSGTKVIDRTVEYNPSVSEVLPSSHEAKFRCSYTLGKILSPDDLQFVLVYFYLEWENCISEEQVSGASLPIYQGSRVEKTENFGGGFFSFQSESSVHLGSFVSRCAQVSVVTFSDQNDLAVGTVLYDSLPAFINS